MKKLSKMIVLLLSVIALAFSVTACRGGADPKPSVTPTVQPTVTPSVTPSVSVTPSAQPTVTPSVVPTVQPTVAPTAQPTVVPTVQPTVAPSVVPSVAPSVVPSVLPSVVPSVAPSVVPSMVPGVVPSVTPSVVPVNTQVTEEEWKTALTEMGDYSGTETISNAMYTQVITFSRKGDVLKVGNEMVGFSYVAKEGDLYYLYDGESKLEIGQEEYEMHVHPYGYMAESFAMFTYNAEKQAYVIETEGVTISVFMQNKKLVKVETANEDMSIVDEITYGEVEDIVLPEVVDPYMVTEEEFNKAVDLQAYVFGENPIDFSYIYIEYDENGDVYGTRYSAYYQGHYYYEELYPNPEHYSWNTWYMWYKTPEEEIEDAYSDIRYYELYKYGDEETWRGKTYSAAKSNWTSGKEDYEYSKKSPLMGEILCVPGQEFVDAWEPPYSTATNFSFYTYDADEQCYYAAEIDLEYRVYYNVRLYFENGVLQGYSYEDKWGCEKEVIFNYDVTPIELPSDFIVEND